MTERKSIKKSAEVVIHLTKSEVELLQIGRFFCLEFLKGHIEAYSAPADFPRGGCRADGSPVAPLTEIFNMTLQKIPLFSDVLLDDISAWRADSHPAGFLIVRRVVIPEWTNQNECVPIMQSFRGFSLPEIALYLHIGKKIKDFLSLKLADRF